MYHSWCTSAIDSKKNITTSKKNKGTWLTFWATAEVNASFFWWSQFLLHLSVLIMLSVLLIKVLPPSLKFFKFYCSACFRKNAKSIGSCCMGPRVTNHFGFLRNGMLHKCFKFLTNKKRYNRCLISHGARLFACIKHNLWI